MFGLSVKKYGLTLMAALVGAAPFAFADEAALEAKIDKLEKKVDSQAEQLQKLERQSASAQTPAAQGRQVGGPVQLQPR